MKTASAAGRAVENEVKHGLEAMGALVQRAARSAFPDLMVLWPDGQPPWLVECKRQRKMPRKEIERLRTLAKRYGAVPVWGSHPPGEPPQVQRLDTGQRLELST